MSKSAREVVLNILERVLLKEEFLTDACDRLLTTDMTDADRRFARLLARGVCERRITLEAVISQRSSVKLSKIKPLLRLILDMALYEMLYMDTREHALVNEAVRLASRRGYSGLRGFVNGLLRNCLRDKEHLLQGLTKPELLAVPEDLWKRLVSWYGEKDAETICRAWTQENTPLTLRHIHVQGGSEDFAAALLEYDCEIEETGILPEAWFVRRTGRLFSSEIFSKGEFYVQDLSSQLIPWLVKNDFSEGKVMQVLDCCASPGGKSIVLCDDHPGQAEILCCDVSEKKTAVIEENIARLQLQGIRTEVRDAAVFDPSLEEKFDLVVADLPCSCLGTVGKRPEIRYHITEELLKENVLIQAEILKNVSHYVKPGGMLLYSTCTIVPEENLLQAERFLKETPAFCKVELTDRVPDIYRESLISGCLQTLPGKTPGDGFFAALFRKEEA